MKKNYFSLIELLIVIAIIGSLTALIMPQFDMSESEAKDAGCDYSQYGTMRTLSDFRSLNGVYPTGWHTGLETQTGSDVMGTNEDSAMADITWGNIDNNATIAALTDAEVESLKLAGIGSLGYGFGIDAKDIANTTTAIKMTADWQENASHENSDAGSGATVTFNGVPYTTPSSGDVTGLEDKYESVIALFAAPTVDWENYYTDGDTTAGQPSKVGAQVGKCPWVKDIFGYYIGYFGTNGTTAANAVKAKLVGTTCPECGPLNP